MNILRRKPSSSPATLFRNSITGLSLFLAASLACAIPSFAAQANLTWNAPTTYTDGSPAAVSGYKIYTGTAPGNYSQNASVGNVTSYTQSGLDDGTTYYFAVAAYDAKGVASGFSNEAAYTTAAPPPPVPTYTITASAGSGGSISPSGGVAISQGLSQTFSITPATGYQIAAVAVDGASVGAVSTYTFGNVTANHTIAASFTSAITSYTITASAGTGGAISPSGSAAVSSGTSKSYTITANAGYKIADVKVDGVSVGTVGSYTFTNVTANHTIQANFVTTAGQLIFATNSGGAKFTSSTGTVYTADGKFSGGSVGKTTSAIAGTVDDALYQSERYGNFSYSVPMANGDYSVTLKFAEFHWSAAGKRVFSVKINGQTVISNLDIYSKAGKNMAYDVTLPVSVTNGVLSINFVSQVNNAKVSGILVKTR